MVATGQSGAFGRKIGIQILDFKGCLKSKQEGFRRGIQAALEIGTLARVFQAELAGQADGYGYT